MTNSEVVEERIRKMMINYCNVWWTWNIGLQLIHKKMEKRGNSIRLREVNPFYGKIQHILTYHVIKSIDSFVLG